MKTPPPGGWIPQIWPYLPAFVFAWAPVVTAARLYNASTPLEPLEVLRTLGVVSLVPVAAAAVLIGRRSTPRAGGAAAALFVIAANTYPSLAMALDLAACSAGDVLVGAAYLAMVVVCLWLLWQHARGLLQASAAPLALVAAVFVAYSAAWLVVHVVRNRRAAAPPQPAPIVLRAPAPRPPDIIHIVFDGLGRLDVLQRDFGIDRGAVAAALDADGLTIADDAVANYAQTFLSVAAMLSADYLDEGAAGRSDRRLPERFIRQGRVIRALQQAGYRFTLLSSGYEALAEHPLAQDGIEGPTWFGQFEAYVLPRTPFRVLPIAALTYEPHRRRTEQVLDALRQFAPGRQPRYLLAHVLLPHPPFVFAADGAPRTPEGPFTIQDASTFPGGPLRYREGYGGQARFALTELHGLLQRWNRLTPRPVVIVNGDHGSGLDYDLYFPDKGRTDGRMSVFLGISRAGHGMVVPRSPVNIYRALFDGVFGTTLGLLPDRSFVSSWEAPFDFREVAVPAPPLPSAVP